MGRHAWLRPVVLVYFLTMVIFGRPILGLYGKGFVAGYPALVLIAVGAGVGVMFSFRGAGFRRINRRLAALERREAGGTGAPASSNTSEPR